MPVTDVNTQAEARTLTITAEFAAPVERVWEVYADPRRLERVWGPPTYPATFVQHSLSEGARTHYFMTSPEGAKLPGWWQVTSVDEPRGFTFDDGFAANADDFTPDEAMPVSQNVYRFEAIDPNTTRATYTSTYATAEGLQRILDMGAVEGSSLAINQIDGLLAS